jgi:hypothetical protein
VVMSPAGLRWRGPAAIVNPSFHRRGCYMKTITASVQLEKRIIGRESQGTCRQEEQIGGKPPVIK